MSTRRERRAMEAKMQKLMDGIDMNTDDLLMLGKRVASMLFEVDGEVVPTFIAQNSDGNHVMIAAPWTSREEKYATYAKLREMFRANGVVRCVHLAEVWSASDSTDRRPSEAPDRREKVMVYVSDKDGGASIALALIERGAGGARLGSWEDSPIVPSLHTALFDPPPMRAN